MTFTQVQLDRAKEHLSRYWGRRDSSTQELFSDVEATLLKSWVTAATLAKSESILFYQKLGKHYVECLRSIRAMQTVMGNNTKVQGL